MNSTALGEELVKILKYRQLTPFFQPIVSLSQKRIIGYEALIRGPSDNPLCSPGALFSVAERFNLLGQLEFICRELSIAKYAKLKLKAKLFLNINPSFFLQPDYKNNVMLKLLKQHRVDPSRIVIELTEHYPNNDYSVMFDAVLHYRLMGFKIAIDDLGCGYSGLRLWSELLPDYVKIDRHFISGLDKDLVKYNFVRSIQNIANALNCVIIAEGVETESEYKAVTDIGINHAQGYYFGRPAAVPVAKLAPELFAKKPDSYFYGQLSTLIAADIARYIPPVAPGTKVSEVMRLFQTVPELRILPLVENGVANGIVFREQFLCQLFAGRYGIELHGKKAIGRFVDNPPLCIAHNTPIQLVSDLLIATALDQGGAFIITRDNAYVGVATVLELLAEITRQQVQYARYANPLTLLPGSVPVNHCIDELLTAARPFVVGYFDLDNFKPFNDVYGYNAGDNIIRSVAEILTRYVTNDIGMVGHIGGDDFIVVFFSTDWRCLCENILEAFAATVPSHYHEKDRQQGGIFAEGRSGEKCFFPLISLSIGLVDTSMTGQCHSHVELSDLAAGAKKQAKKMPGNSYFVDRRDQVNVLSLSSPTGLFSNI